jgi:hypothetical protein
MRRLYPPLAAGLVALVLAGVWASASVKQNRPKPILSDTNKNPACKLVGVASCAAMACHGSNEPRGTKGSEYSAWVDIDPHSRSQQALYKPVSRRMHQILAKAFPGLRRYKGAEENPVCLDCHGQGGKEPERLQGDGIGCERCHGPAKDWLSTHYLDDFDRNGCFNDLRLKLGVRLYVCTKCHVGDASQEVNHVLIAAGHPRLRFEPGAYYARYATEFSHWADLGEKRREPGFEARTWVVGQLVGARSALELLEARAGDPRRANNWPEFAEYDCTACHHDLTTPSQRQERSLKMAGKERAGDLPWGTWYYPLLPVLNRYVPGAPAELWPTLTELNRLMRLRRPPRPQVTARAHRALELLDQWIAGVRRVPFTEARVKAMMKAVASQTGPVDQGWDGGMQVYLGLAALNQARGDINPRFKAARPLNVPLADMRKALKYSFEPGGRTLYDTPNDYPKRLDQIFRGLNAIRRSE